jgi:hypothetical protein
MNRPNRLSHKEKRATTAVIGIRGLVIRLDRGFEPARPTDEYHVTGGLCMAGGGESCCAFRSWMLSHKFRRDALELRFHRIEELMVFGRVTAEKRQSASLSW